MKEENTWERAADLSAYTDKIEAYHMQKLTRASTALVGENVTGCPLHPPSTAPLRPSSTAPFQHAPMRPRKFFKSRYYAPVKHNTHAPNCSAHAPLVVTAVYLAGDSSRLLIDQETHKNPFPSCDFSSGKWVYDNKSQPLYKEQNCSFMVEDFACEKYGRKDLKYQEWRWQPNDCDLPRFNAKALLEKLRDKRLVFAGDSLNKNQWISLLCLIDSAIPTSQKHANWHNALITFKATEYNASIDFYWEPLLVESNCDDPVNHHVRNRVFRESMEKHARQWSDADLLVFDSFMWWREPNMKLLRGSFEDTNATYEDVEEQLGYEIALRTWSDWLDVHINRTKTRLFFMSLSPYHKKAEEWGMSTDQNCYNETEPILEEGHWGSGSDVKMMRAAEATIQGLAARGLKVQILNITQLSEYRKEAHPTIYRKHWIPPTKEQLLNPKSYSDCVHWCLPGVPDVWNQILFAYILHDS
ncbi:hypothetical protein RJ639_037502 [Escallonia herrerae]|uniref:Trichome birefringence-like N-terminal domain-containing protein n=1 Tax=Escallonia herrerae TaxID=1293975 RepID=A0AA88WKF5_9ASTE|nr:hypothetical protein RJ639_037502 [Escallonia herrerae]